MAPARGPADGFPTIKHADIQADCRPAQRKAGRSATRVADRFRGLSSPLRGASASGHIPSTCKRAVSVSCPVLAHEKPLRSGQNRRKGGVLGAPCRIRTDDPRFTRAVLWPTELRRHSCAARCLAAKRAGAWTLDKVSPRTPGGKNGGNSRLPSNRKALSRTNPEQGLHAAAWLPSARAAAPPLPAAATSWRRWRPAGTGRTASGRCRPCPTACLRQRRSACR